MSDKISGVVQAVASRSTDWGDMWRIKVGGTDYGVGKFKPKCNEGDTVEFEVSYNGKYPNVTPKTLRVVDGGGASSARPTSTAAPASSGGKDDYWARKEAGDEARQTTISKQAALNSALQMVDLLVKGGGLAQAASPAKAAATIEAAVEIYRARFYKENTGHDLVPATADKAASEATSWAEDEDED